MGRHRSCNHSTLRCCSGSRAGCPPPNQSWKHLRFAIIAGVFCPLLVAFASDIAPTPQPVSQPGVTIEQVIVTGSNIPTAEEVGPNPVDTYRPGDLEKLGIRNATDLLVKLPQEAGSTMNQNIANGGDGSVAPNLRGLLPKETLVLVDGKRVAAHALDITPVTGNVIAGADISLIPFRLID